MSILIRFFSRTRSIAGFVVCLCLFLVVACGRSDDGSAEGEEDDDELPGELRVELTVQEALYAGSVAGIDRTDEPVTVGIPLPDDDDSGATEISALALEGADVGQFRVLGRWPSGRIKWVLVDTLASLSAGETATGIALTGAGGGNFGGDDLAADAGDTITIDTGAARFVIRKARFNGFDQVDVGGTTVVATGASTGLVVTGPAPGETACGTCTTQYSSANDAGSTAEIEENGPVRAVIRATGTHRDAAGNPYMNFTVRMYFSRGQSRVKTTSTLRNADFGGTGTFASAYKGHEGYEWRIAPSLGSSPAYRIALHGGAVESGTLAAGGEVALYQGESRFLQSWDWCAAGCVPYTPDRGYAVTRDGVTVATGADTDVPEGWADLTDDDGAGVTIGVYQLAAYGPKSLELSGGGRDVRIGIWPRQSSQPYYQAWPQWSTHDLYFDFHAATPPAPGDGFLRFQHHLIARAPREHYNATHALAYPIVDPVVEDEFFASTHATANPANNFPFLPPRDAFPGGDGTSPSGHWLAVHRYRAWSIGGESNQQEFRWGWLLNWIQRGFTGRYLNAAHFYRMQTDDTLPHSDGFSWRDHPDETDGFGRPSPVISTNDGLAHRNWFDQDHAHWYGMPDFYFMTGDELVKESLLDGYADWHLDDSSYQAGDFGGLFDSRATSLLLIGASRMATFLAAVGLTDDAETVLDNATSLFDEEVRPVLCTAAEQASQGCTTGPANGGPWEDHGVSRTRGLVWNGGGTVNYCGIATSGLRFHSSWATGAFMQQGLLELSDARGPGWDDYWLARDLAIGLSRGNDDENYVELGNDRWDEDHWRAGIVFDIPGACASGEYDDYWVPRVSVLSHWMTFYTQYRLEGRTDWGDDVRKSMVKAVNYNGVLAADFYGYQLGAVIHALHEPSAQVLQEVPIDSVADGGDGVYTISWTVPEGANSYRIKWGAKRIVDWIGFDPATNQFTGDPFTTMNWFAAETMPDPPAPGEAGSVQSQQVRTGTSGLSVANFSVKAYVDR